MSYIYNPNAIGRDEIDNNLRKPCKQAATGSIAELSPSSWEEANVVGCLFDLPFKVNT